MARRRFPAHHLAISRGAAGVARIRLAWIASPASADRAAIATAAISRLRAADPGDVQPRGLYADGADWPAAPL